MSVADLWLTSLGNTHTHAHKYTYIFFQLPSLFCGHSHFTIKVTMVTIGLSKDGRYGCAPPSPTPVQFPPFSCSVRQRFCQVIGFCSKIRNSAPPPREILDPPLVTFPIYFIVFNNHILDPESWMFDIAGLTKKILLCSEVRGIFTARRYFLISPRVLFQCRTIKYQTALADWS